MNKDTFCSRKGGATINGEFRSHPRTSEILARQIERDAIKMEGREAKRLWKSKYSHSTNQKKDESALRGRQFIELFVAGKVYSRKRRADRLGKLFTLNPISFAKRMMSKETS